jgi:hypothetical protein
MGLLGVVASLAMRISEGFESLILHDFFEIGLDKSRLSNHNIRLDIITLAFAHSHFMSTFYIKRGTTYSPTDEASVVIERMLPVGNYVVKQTPEGVLYLDTVDSFTFPFKRYGKNPRQSARILDTFLRRPTATGVLLAGEKGSGKSLLAKTVSMDAAEQGIPTIVINAPWHGDVFNSFIQSIEQPAVVLFDEFEKVYDKDEQEQILTLLDGVFPSKKLFIITCNDKWRIDGHMRNRPGRIFYMIDFTGLDAAFIEEYCNDNLVEKKYIPGVCKLAGLFTEFNFDMLKALVEEMNRYDESPAEAVEMLNVRPEYDEGKISYAMVLTRGEGTILKLHTNKYSGNPLTDEDVEVHYRPSDNEQSGWIEVDFTPDHMRMFTTEYVTFVKDDLTLTLTRTRDPKVQRYDWRDTI